MGPMASADPIDSMASQDRSSSHRPTDRFGSSFLERDEGVATNSLTASTFAGDRPPIAARSSARRTSTTMCVATGCCWWWSGPRGTRRAYAGHAAAWRARRPCVSSYVLLVLPMATRDRWFLTRSRASPACFGCPFSLKGSHNANTTPSTTRT